MSDPETDKQLPQDDAPEPVGTALNADQSDSSAEAPEAHKELLRTDEYTEYLLHSPLEILSVLRQVAEHGDLVTIYFNSGKDFLLTSLISVGEDGIRLDHGSNSEMNRRALAAEKLFCITRHAKVKLQFILTGVREDTFDRQKVFAAALPETLLRLQRREFFRLNTPITRPLICRVPLQYPDGHTATVEINIVDISAGGVAVIVPPDDMPFEADMEFPNCVVDLPEIGVITVTLKVRNLYEITLRSGQRSKRSGCQFVNLIPAAQNMIQRYITKIERERKARESGLA
ncbi:MAG TPA: flagellar brake protein [Rhodocyclaceae bacterium]|nr:flagellar brake protein [Rhodocyclaceae bacterium]